MTIQQFIEKAIEGGWRFHNTEPVGKPQYHGAEYGSASYPYDHNHNIIFYIEQILLDPEAWKAVGKAEGWGAAPYVKNGSFLPEAQHRMLNMVMALWDGKTIEEYLATL